MMTPKELAKHLAGRAHMCSISTSETHTLAAEAYMSAAKLIRHHLCTPEFAPEFHFSNCEIRPRKGASMDVTSGGVSLDRYAIVALELLPPGFWEHVDGAPLPNPLHDAAPDMLAAEYQRGRADEKQEWMADAKAQAENLDQERRDDAAWNRSAFNV